MNSVKDNFIAIIIFLAPMMPARLVYAVMLKYETKEVYALPDPAFIYIENLIDQYASGLSDEHKRRIDAELRLLADDEGRIAAEDAPTIMNDVVEKLRPKIDVFKFLAEKKLKKTLGPEKNNERGIEEEIYYSPQEIFMKNNLIAACLSGDLAAIETLLQNNMTENVMNTVFPSLSTLSKIENILSVTKLFLHYGADPNACDEAGNTLAYNLIWNTSDILSRNALHHPYTASRDLIKFNKAVLDTIIQIILAGLDLEHKNNKGNTLLELDGNLQAMSPQVWLNSYETPSSISWKHEQLLLGISTQLKAAKSSRYYIKKACKKKFFRGGHIEEIICDYYNAPGKRSDINRDIKLVENYAQLMVSPYSHYHFTKQVGKKTILTRFSRDLLLLPIFVAFNGMLLELHPVAMNLLFWGYVLLVEQNQYINKKEGLIRNIKKTDNDVFFCLNTNCGLEKNGGAVENLAVRHLKNVLLEVKKMELLYNATACPPREHFTRDGTAGLMKSFMNLEKQSFYGDGIINEDLCPQYFKSYKNFRQYQDKTEELVCNISREYKGVVRSGRECDNLYVDVRDFFSHDDAEALAKDIFKAIKREKIFPPDNFSHKRINRIRFYWDFEKLIEFFAHDFESEKVH